MALFRFIGSGEQDPQTITLYGATFELNGEPQDVTGPAADKLSGNSHFIEVKPEDFKMRRSRPVKTDGDQG